MGEKEYGDRFFCGFILSGEKPGLYVVENEGKSFSPPILQEDPYVVRCTTSTVHTDSSHTVS
jgi:hypothetical protein